MTLPSPRSDVEPAGRIAELDILRGLAAVMVVLYHFTFFIADMVPGTPRATVQVVYGCHGVQLFFAISGFVILLTIDRAESVRAFASARFWRLAPTYWMAMAVTFVAMQMFGPGRLQTGAADFIANLTMVQWFVQPFVDIRMVDGAYWSLNVEVMFYAAMAGLWRLRLLARIEALLIGWMAIKWCAAFLPEPLDRLLLLDQVAFFAIGIASYRVWSGQRRLLQQAPVLVMAVATVMVTNTVDRIVLVIGLIALFCAIASGWLRRLRCAPLEWLGAISYPLYLLHSYIGYAIISKLNGRGVSVDVAVAWALAIVVAISAVLVYGLEIPLRRAIGRRTRADERLTALPARSS